LSSFLLHSASELVWDENGRKGHKMQLFSCAWVT
jgi:hypothetical protein